MSVFAQVTVSPTLIVTVSWNETITSSQPGVEEPAAFSIVHLQMLEELQKVQLQKLPKVKKL